MQPIVSSEWLAANKDLNGLVVVDIRTAAEYQADHISGSVNLPFETPVSAWISNPDGLLLELPDPAELFVVLGGVGITPRSTVVVVGSVGQPPFPQAGSTRVADTLIYAGVKDVSILDGGYPKWVELGYETTTDTTDVNPVTFNGTVNGKAYVDTAYVAAHLNTTVIVDGRDAAVYAGEVVEPWAEKPGHIPSAVSLPAPQIWNADGTFANVQTLRTAVAAVAGADTKKEVIVYCGVGGYASSWLYVMTRMLGYQNVKMYDGSAQEWVRTHDMEI